MTKPQEAVKSAQSAVETIRSQATKIRKDRDDTAAEIAKLNAEINRLNKLPVSKKDFSLLLKEHIAAQSKHSEKILISTLTSETKNSVTHMEKEVPSYDNMPLEKLKCRQFRPDKQPIWILSDWIAAYGDFLGGRFFTDSSNNNNLTALCYFFPDVVHDRIMQTIEAHYGDKWGNEELPSVNERRETIINLKEEIKDLENRLADLDAAIAEFTRLTAQPSDEDEELTEYQRMVLANM